MLPPPPFSQPPLPPPPSRPSPPPAREPRLTTAGLIGFALIAGSLVTVALVGIVALRPFSAAAPTAAPSLAAVSASMSPPAPTEPATPDSPGPSASSGAPASPTPTDPPVENTPVAPDPSPAAQPSSTINLPKLSASIPGATGIHYYAIAGDAPLDLVRQMERKGSRNCGADALACVHLSVSPHVRYRLNFATGACSLVGASPTLSAVVYVPRWSKPARIQRPLLAWWRELFDHITWHEGHHIRIERAWMRKLSDRLAGKPCASAARIVRRWAAQVSSAQDAFDARELETFHYPEYTGPGGWDGTSVP